MSENQPNDLEERAGRAADELSEDHATKPDDKPTDEKAEEIADDVRAETGGVYEEEEDIGDDSPSST